MDRAHDFDDLGYSAEIRRVARGAEGERVIMAMCHEKTLCLVDLFLGELNGDGFHGHLLRTPVANQSLELLTKAK